MKTHVRVQLVKVSHVVVAHIVDSRVTLVLGRASWSRPTHLVGATLAHSKHSIDKLVDTVSNQVTHTTLLTNCVEQSTLALRRLLSSMLCCCCLLLHAEDAIVEGLLSRIPWLSLE